MNPFGGLTADVRFAARQIRKQPALALTAIAVLALGIGSSVAIFSFLYEALLKPLPYPRADELVFVHNIFPKGQIGVANVSAFDYAELARRKDVFAKAAIYYYNDLTLTGAGTARHIDAVNASASFFETFGTLPELGRTFSEAEDAYGAPKTVVLSDRFWRSNFAGDPGILGRAIHLNETAYTVIGIMPRAFAFPSDETQVWIPTALRRGEFTIEGGRMEKWLRMVARLAPGVPLEGAQAALETASGRLSAHFPAFYPRAAGWRFIARRIADENTGSIRRWLYLTFGAVLSVLLIACINVGGLLLIRGHARRGELAVRLALGAAKTRLIRQMLVESGCLAAAGAAGGMVFAVWAVALVNRYGPLPHAAAIQPWTLLFAGTIAVVSTVAAGLIPALVSVQLPLEQSLRNTASRTTTATGVWRNAIVAAQIGLAVTLTFTAAGLSRSFTNLSRVPAGFDSRQVWSGALTLASRNYSAPDSWNARFFEPLLAGLRAIPGVSAASGSNGLPFNPSGVWAESLRIPGRAKIAPPPEAQIGLALPGYFETLKIPMLRGRAFTAQDRAGSAPVAIIDEVLAARYFPNENPVGHLIASGGMETPARIVGVAGNVVYSDLAAAREPQIYFPELQERSEAMYLVLRTKGNADPAAAVRDLIARLDPSVALFDVENLDERVARSLSLRRFVAFLLRGFAALGILLAGVGLYGSLAHLVELRRREIGIRVAVGAAPQQIVSLIVARAGAVAGLGLAAGVAGSLVASRMIRAQLFGVTFPDPATWATVLALAGLLVLIATGLPARRAAQIDPSVALREE